MKLVPLYKFLIREQSESVIEFTGGKFSVSVFRSEKKISFNPSQSDTSSKNIKEYIDIIKDRFLTLKINELEDGFFEIEFDPREDFDAVIDFLKNEAVDEAG